MSIPIADQDHEAELLRALLQADGVCYWRDADDGVRIPVACAPISLIDCGFLLALPEEPILLEYGAPALQRLPFMLRAGLEAASLALLTLTCEPGGGCFAFWRDAAAVPGQVGGLAEFARQAFNHRLAYLSAADSALESHLQMRGLLGALPLGVVIVPNNGTRGFANKAAAAWLGVDVGDVGAAALSAALTRFAGLALNPEALGATLASLQSSAPSHTACGGIWRFASAPHALRVTAAPIVGDSLLGWVWLLDDVSAEESARDRLRESAEKFRLFYRSLQDAVVFFDMEGGLVEWNDAYRHLLGFDDAALATMRVDQITPAAWSEKLAPVLAVQLAADGHSARYEKEVLAADGRCIPVEARTFLRKDATGLAIGMWEVVRDITEQKQAEAQLILAAQVFDRSGDGVVLASPGLTIQTVNEAFVAMTGYARVELIGQGLSLLRSERHDEAFYGGLRTQLHAHGAWQGEIWSRKKNGDLLFKWLSLAAVKGDDGAVSHYIAMYRDAAIVSQSHQRIEYLATHDELTALPNRTVFNDRFGLALEGAARDGQRLALLLLDLDDFKTVNDTMGHAVGDALLVEAASRLQRALPPGGTVARSGGDEFLVLLTDTSIGAADAVCERIGQALAEPYLIATIEAFVPASIGACLFPDDGRDAATLLRKVDIALHHAKRQGKNSHRFFAAAMAEHMSRQLRIESGLRQALPRGELFLHYQPQIDLDDGRLAGCEALLRWQDGADVVSPLLFIPIAEQSGQIVEITEWVLAAVCRQIAEWDATGVMLPYVSVNMSARHFRHPERISCLRSIVAAAGLTPARICLEITEGVLMDAAHCEPLLLALKADGFQLSVDDFGTGFSSLSYLKRFPIDELKVDRSFVTGITENAGDRTIVLAILSMAHSMGMRVVAEGVETREQLRFLRESGCDCVQGYLFERPLAADEFRARVRGGRGAYDVQS
ncbi:sensor domain-containing protein [Paludibacterium yongneupense]|uniref:sensor domain-containing protein n=1 Tax=Paludibacterium yongneupense TaxID=400061 RepID=UPI00041C27DC|nr:bifunctional diguanylate cyclase/phosphodiesterase [Paludibacterium yongneupense]